MYCNKQLYLLLSCTKIQFHDDCPSQTIKNYAWEGQHLFSGYQGWSLWHRKDGYYEHMRSDNYLLFPTVIVGVGGLSLFTSLQRRSLWDRKYSYYEVTSLFIVPGGNHGHYWHGIADTFVYWL